MSTCLGPRPYDHLSPQVVLAAIDEVGLHGDGRILQLNSFENRVYQLFLESGAAIVAKFYRPGRWSDEQILEEHALALELADAEVPVVPPQVLPKPAGLAEVRLHGTPPTLASIVNGEQRFRFAIAERCAGRDPELEIAGRLRQIGRFLGRFHTVGARRPFLHRSRLDVRGDGERARRTILEGQHLPEDIRAAWEAWSARALEAAAAVCDGVGDLDRLRIHGDCHPGNVLWRGDGPHMVDLDDACMGPAVQDFWMLLSGDRTSMTRQMAELLDGYRSFRDHDPREFALIEPLRTLRMLRHSAWIAERWQDPAFPASFPFFGTPAYWSEQVTQLREQIEAMAQPPLSP